MTVAVKVNGRDVSLATRSDTPLCYALRNELGLKGVRFGCGEGYCGACTVLVGDEDRLSCQITVGEVAGCAVTTVEGVLHASGALGPVQQVLAEEQAGQCGFCLAGIVMRIEAGLREPAPTRASLKQKLAENLCRCGIHPRVLRAVDRLVADRSAP